MSNDDQFQSGAQPPDHLYPTLDPAAASTVIADLVDVIQARSAGALTPEALSLVRDVLDAQLRAAEKLHAYPLTNADEPAFVFVPRDEE